MTNMAMVEKYAGKKRKQGKTLRSQRNFSYRLTSFSEQHGLCFWCHKPMDQPVFGLVVGGPTEATCEHIVRLADGGADAYWNIVAAHKVCNNSRHSDPGVRKGIRDDNEQTSG